MISDGSTGLAGLAWRVIRSGLKWGERPRETGKGGWCCKAGGEWSTRGEVMAALAAHPQLNACEMYTAGERSEMKLTHDMTARLGFKRNE